VLNTINQTKPYFVAKTLENTERAIKIRPSRETHKTKENKTKTKIQYWCIDGKYRIFVARLRHGGKTSF
jgi:hypothetical protein